MESKIYLGRYRLLLDEIGVPTVLRRSASEGTFKAEEISTHEKVALQLIPLAQLGESQRALLEEEAERAKAITHLNIPAVRAFGIEGEHFVCVTELFEGTSADAWIKERGPMPVGPVLRIGAQMVSAMAAAAFQGIFHAALNPGNVMLVPGQTADGEWPLIKVLNFIGVAPILSPGDAIAADAQAAINFASPEQVERGAFDFRSEVYSLGCTLWFLLSGVPPLAGAATVENAPGLPAPVRALLGSLLADDPQARPLDPVVLQERFQDCLSQAERRDVATNKLPAPVVLPVAATTPRVRTRRSFPIKPLAIAAALLLLAGTAALVLPEYLGGAKSVDQMGVPIGVPEATAAPVVVTRAEPPPVEAPAPATTIAAEGDREPQVLTSTASAATEETPTAGVAGNSEGTVAAAEPSPEPTVTDSALIAVNEAGEAAPPSEAPPNESSPRPIDVPPTPNESSDAVVTYAQPTPAPIAETPAETVAAIPPSPPPAAETAQRFVRIAPAPREVEKKVEVTRVERQPAKRTRVVAQRNDGRLAQPAGALQFLGVTPTGEPVFGPVPDHRRVSGRQARRPGERVENLPVLRALPPDQ